MLCLCALRVNKCEFCENTDRIFVKCTWPKQLINSSPTDFPCSADEIAEPRPGMNIKIAAFTVSEKSINIHLFLSKLIFC